MQYEYPALFAVERTQKQDAGPMEQQMINQLQAMKAAGSLNAEHAGISELCIIVARDIDDSQGVGRPSGRAALYKTLNECVQTLPEPLVDSGSTLAKVLELIDSPGAA